MSYRCFAIVGTKEYNLDDQDVYTILDDEGLDAAPVRLIEEQGPLQHGTTITDFRLEPRTIILKELLRGSSSADFWDRRAEVLQIFRPRRGGMQLRFELDNGAVRQIDVQVSNGPKLSGSGRVASSAQEAAIALRAGDPTFYDPERRVVAFSGLAGGTPFLVPTSVPTSIGSSTLSVTQTISYAGTWRASPEIEVVGPVTDLAIVNLASGDRLSFAGFSLAAGERWMIDTRYGQTAVYDPTVGDVLLANRIDRLSDDSDLAAFGLETDPVAPDGQNSIQVTGTGATAATAIYIRYYDRFVGF